MSCRDTEYVINGVPADGPSETLVPGEVVHFVPFRPARTVDRAIGGAVPTLPAVGVTAATIARGDEGPIVTCGKALVLLEVSMNGPLTPAANDPLWVSATQAGRATPVAPMGHGDPFFLGIVKDASGFRETGAVIADIRPGLCCWYASRGPM